MYPDVEFEIHTQRECPVSSDLRSSLKVTYHSTSLDECLRQVLFAGKAWVERTAKSMHMDKCKALRFWCSTEKIKEALGIESRAQLLEEALVFGGHVLAFYSLCVPLYVLLVRRRGEAGIGVVRAACWMLLHAAGLLFFFLDHLRVFDAVFHSIGRAFTWTTFDYMRYLYYNRHQTCDELLTFS